MIMKKVNKILFTFLAVTSSLSGSVSTKSSPSYSNFGNVKRENITTPSVYEDLAKLGIDTSIYEAKLSPEMITLAESEIGQLFIYVFDISGKYDSIDISYSFDPASEKFVKYKLTQVASEKYITKYLINNIISDMASTKRRYAVRQVYNSKNKNKIDGIIAVALEYLFEKDSSGNSKMKVNTLDKVVVTSKLVAYEMLKNGASDSTWYTNQTPIDENVVKTGYNYIKNNITPDGNKNIYHYIQSNYIAFNTNIDITDIVEVTINYDYNVYRGNTVHGDDMKTDYPLCNINLTKSSFDQNSKYYEVTQYLTRSVSVKPENINYSYMTNNFFSFKKVVSSFSTIQKVSDLENKTNEVSKYTWLVRFGNNDVLSRGTYTDILTTRHFVYNYYDYQNVSLMTLHYVKNGETKQAVFIDTYQDNAGNVPTTDPEDLTLLDLIIRAFRRVFTNKGAELMDYFYVIGSVITGLCLLIIISWLLTRLVKILKH